MASSSIIAYFGGDTKGLREATEESTIIVKGFSRQASTALREIGHGFIGAVVLMEMVKAAKEAVDQAQKTRDAFDEMGKPLDSSTRSLADFGDGIDTVKHGIGSFVGFVVSGWTQIAEGIDRAVLEIAGYEKADESLINMERKVAAETTKNLADIAAARARYNADNSPDKLAAEEKKYADQVRKDQEAYLTGQEKINALIEDFVELEKQAQDPKNHEGTVNYLKIREQMETVSNNLTKARLDYEKEIQKTGEEIFKAEVDTTNQFEKTAKPVAKIAEDVQDIDAYIKSLAANASSELLPAMKQIQDAADAIDNSMSDAFDKMKGSGSALGGGSEFSTASNATLAEIVKQSAAAANAINTGPFSSISSDIAKAQQVSRAAAAQKELDSRKQILFNESFGGDAYARSQFRGDPLAFDQFLAQAKAGGPLSQDATLTAINKNLTTINTTLNGVFKK